ncbi:TIGR04255 family protein [Alteromonas macleodii]|jgi:uncharacterized protein (TIGR04255 family)|uniref:TIGR04255 family protein n=1 Tax=Alteromonas macleodii TaxID=28108 RepID=UPI00313A8405|tara:strand:- start:2297 stop:3097 length:801 start_codon:yes stop_codon:yes gene_type:complete
MPNSSDVSYKAPPIVEKALSIQFRPLESFHVALLGVIWDAFKAEYPKISYESRLEHTIERFGIPFAHAKPSFKLLDKPEAPRTTFISLNEEYLIQVQDDRFVLNWRKTESNSYPRHQVLIEKLLKEFGTFKGVLMENGIDSVEPDQLEIINVNHIEDDNVSLDKAFDSIMSNSSIAMSDVEGFSCNFSQFFEYEGKKIGRIYTNLEKAKRKKDLQDIFGIKITARAHPIGASNEELVKLFDKLRCSVNSVFDSVTTAKFQETWGKQ